MRIATEPNPDDFRVACATGGRAMENMMHAVTIAYRTRLLRYSAFLCGHAALADDAVQMALIQIWRSCATFATGNLLGWARTIVRNETFDLMRGGAHGRHVPLEDERGQWIPEAEAAMARHARVQTPDDDAAQAQHLALLETLMARFEADHPDHVRALYCAVQGLSGDEIAKELGRSPGATRELLSQARRKAEHYLRAWRELVRTGEPTTTRTPGDDATRAGETA